jgi:hypothetical protein
MISNFKNCVIKVVTVRLLRQVINLLRYASLRGIIPSRSNDPGALYTTDAD